MKGREHFAFTSHPDVFISTMTEKAAPSESQGPQFRGLTSIQEHPLGAGYHHIS